MKYFLDPEIEPPSTIYKAKGKNVRALAGYMSVTIIKMNENQIDEETLTFNNVARIFLTFKIKLQTVNIWSNTKPFLIAQIPSKKILVMDVSNAQPTGKVKKNIEYHLDLKEPAPGIS